MGSNSGDHRRTIIWIGMLAGAFVLLLPAAHARATFPGDNGAIAFSWDLGGNRDIYRINADGSGLVRLTHTTESEYDPAWSPDGSRIVFSRSDGIWLVGYYGDGNGSGLTHLRSTGWSPAWSSDGNRLFFSDTDTNGQSSIYVQSANGTGSATPIATIPDYEPYNANASPNGQKVAFAVRPGCCIDSQIYTVNPDGTGLDHVSVDPDGGAIDDFPNWSPDSSRILLLARAHTAPYPNGVITFDPDGANPAQIRAFTGGEDTPAWSPDQTKIVFALSSPNGLHTMNADGSGQFLIPNTSGGLPLEPDWQPVRPLGYARPKTATPTTIKLVPAEKQCASPNATHGTPLAVTSCSPPQEASDYLTVGIPDRPGNGNAANFAGYLTAKVLTEAPIDLTNGDQSDVAFAVSLTDVRKKSDLTDYLGELRASFGLRLTDRLNGPGGVHPGTTVDTSFGFSFSCAATGTGIGSTCSASTTADAITPGITPEAKRAIWQMGQVQVYDGGADGDGDTTGDNTLFATQGLFTP